MTSDSVFFYLNGLPQTVSGRNSLLQMSDYLRLITHNTGTKVVCAEGDCGACTVIKTSIQNPERLEVVNSCIAPVYLFDSCHVITVEGLKQNDRLHPVQEAMVNCHGGQCGFCTPGFVMALTCAFENDKTLKNQKAKNQLTGNLCRCTGYLPILDAAESIDSKEHESLRSRYISPNSLNKLSVHSKKSIRLESKEHIHFLPTDISEALDIKSKYPELKIIAGSTDLGVLQNKGRWEPVKTMSLLKIKSLNAIEVQKDFLFVGANISISSFENSLEKIIPELSEFLTIFASPQIKNHATVIGNIANASPIADIPPSLYCLNAELKVLKKGRERTLSILDLMTGYKQLNLDKNEIIAGIKIPVPNKERTFKLYKISQRRDLDISCINAAIYLEKKGTEVKDLRISLGGVGPTTLRFNDLESQYKGKVWNPDLVNKISNSLITKITPLDDARGSSTFRKLMVENLFKKFYIDSQKDIQ